MNSRNEISYSFKYYYVHFRPHLDLRLSPRPSSIIHHPSSHTPHESRMSFNDPTESNSTGSHPNTCSLKCKFHPHGLEELKAEKSTIQKWLDFYPQKIDSWIPANSYWKASMLFRSYVSFREGCCLFLLKSDFVFLLVVLLVFARHLTGQIDNVQWNDLACPVSSGWAM